MHAVASPPDRTGRRRRARGTGGAALAVAALVGGSLLAGAPPAAAAGTGAGGHTVTVGATGRWTHPTDSPAFPYLDRDGRFWFQQSEAEYAADDARRWYFYTGTTFDDATLSKATSTAVNPADPRDRNDDTTYRCNHSPTGRTATAPPAGSGYSQRNYCDLIGAWVDPDTGHWLGIVHNEFTPQPFGDGLHYDALDYAVSADRGRTWTIEGHVLTSPYSTRRGDTAAFPHETYSYGDGDPRLYADPASGYVYVYYGSRVVDKDSTWKAFYAHVARAPMSAKMAPGSWRKWYAGHWSQPGVGGRESNLVPVDAHHPSGYTAPAREYDPRRAGTAEEQIAAGTIPATSPLFAMNITYDAYLGEYIGTPETQPQDGSQPVHYYATDDLATQRWRPIGDTGAYHSGSWYRWFLDGVNRTGTSVVGKDFRAYCSIECSGHADGEYVNVSVTRTGRTAPSFADGRTHRIASGAGRVLTQAGTGSATTSVRGRGSRLARWSFVSDGDGSYRIVNAATGGLLGVDATSPRTRAWGTAPTVAGGRGAPGVGRQWFVVPVTTAHGAPTGRYRLVNRYSGLALALSATRGRRAETTPVRAWTAPAHAAAGAGRTAAEQTLRLG